MTEAEMKTKWCPFARVQFSHASINRSFQGEPLNASLCIGSACALWVDTSPHSYRKLDTEVPVGRCGMEAKP